MVKRFRTLVRHRYHIWTFRCAMLRPRWYEKLRRGWPLLPAEPEFAFMLDPEPRDEWVAIDCETTASTSAATRSSPSARCASPATAS